MDSKRYRPALLAVILIVLLAAGFTVYRLPAVHNRLEWRIEIAKTYVRGVFQPVKPLPTALPLAQLSVATLTPTSTLASAATATAQPTPAATHTPAATATPAFTPTPLPGRMVLTPPSYEVQDINNCGPTTLSMYLQFYGWEGDQQDIAEVVKPVRQDRNVNVDELLFWAQTNVSWLHSEFRVGGTLDQLRQLLAAGIPVMIEEGFLMEESYWPNDDRWSGHYLLVYGYDDQNRVFYAQDSYLGPNRVVNYADLDSSWQAFNRVYLLLFPPEQLGTVQSILGSDWDPDENRENALATARKESQNDPNNPFAWFNLGANLAYFEQYSEAAQAYDQARGLNLPQRMLRYQFGPFFAYFHSGRIEDLVALTDYALQRTPNSEEALLWHGWAMYRLGKRQEAVDAFYKALEVRADYGDALYALDFVLAN
ncbi:MAG TPA: C39 family peptidase [Anaerolineaceae bacterium]|nr:C39 family peptidase [Anaerolineaceae bacterium]